MDENDIQRRAKAIHQVGVAMMCYSEYLFDNQTPTDEDIDELYGIIRLLARLRNR